jgi:hypothetical protein
VLVVPAAPAGASTAGSSSADATAAEGARKKPSRLGGRVHRAWPAPGAKGRPKTPLTRWLARQVGPQRPMACNKRPAKARARCAARKAPARTASAAALAPTVASAAGGVTRPTERVRVAAPTGSDQLGLVRSFDIPVDDPSYDRLLNWAWTYDSALVATAFSSAGLPKQAARLLDQMAALQRKNGSIEFAFDVRSGESSTQIRAGSIAFAGIAFTEFDLQYEDKRYLDNARLAADYLLSLRNGDGLVRGGPHVKWVSTQHNIFSFVFLAMLSESLEQRGDTDAASAYREAAEEIAKGVDSQLVVRDDGPLHFRQGVNDDTLPLDAQALGVMYATFRGDSDLAKQTYAFAQENFQVTDRSIERSKDEATYNMTYEAKGPFSGYRPYLGKHTPDVLWFEGTAEMRLISSSLGGPIDELDRSMRAWWDVTRKDGLAPLGADRTVTGNPYNEYHVWPTAAAGGWTVLSGAGDKDSWVEPPQEELE